MPFVWYFVWFSAILVLINFGTLVQVGIYSRSPMRPYTGPATRGAQEGPGTVMVLGNCQACPLVVQWAAGGAAGVMSRARGIESRSATCFSPRSPAASL